jgi:hypothetical protein
LYVARSSFFLMPASNLISTTRTRPGHGSRAFSEAGEVQ